MNDLLLDVTKMLRKNIDKQEENQGYIIKDVKTYYDLEYSLRIAVKVLRLNDYEEEIIVLGGDYVGDFTDEDEQKWFEELN